MVLGVDRVKQLKRLDKGFSFRQFLLTQIEMILSSQFNLYVERVSQEFRKPNLGLSPAYFVR